jgi:hypothetical protein
MTVFIANRTDGLGARLLNLLVTMALAERYEGEFQFTWRGVRREFHAVDHAEALFDGEFLARHLVAPKKLWKWTAEFIEPDDDLSEEAVRGRLDRGRTKVVVSRADRPADLLRLFPSQGQTVFARAFSNVRFTASLEKARRIAEEIELPRNPIALHLRSGDIVFGGYRFAPGFENKVITLPLAYKLIRAATEKGESPVLFGQDQAACKRISDLFGLARIGDLVDVAGMNEAERAILEMVVLSRMTRIIGGLSSFIQVPAIIGAVPIGDPAISLAPSAHARIIADGVGEVEGDAAYDRLEIAFAYRSAIHYGGQSLDDAEQLAALDGAIRNDPGNAYYRVCKAAALARRGDWIKADRALADAFHHESSGVALKDRNAFHVLSRRKRNGPLEIAAELPALMTLAEQGQPHACLAVALCERRTGNYIPALRHIATARRALPEDKLVAEAECALRKEAFSIAGGLRFCRAHMRHHADNHLQR